MESYCASSPKRRQRHARQHCGKISPPQTSAGDSTFRYHPTPAARPSPTRRRRGRAAAHPLAPWTLAAYMALSPTCTKATSTSRCALAIDGSTSGNSSATHPWASPLRGSRRPPTGMPRIDRTDGSPPPRWPIEIAHGISVSARPRPVGMRPSMMRDTESDSSPRRRGIRRPGDPGTPNGNKAGGRDGSQPLTVGGKGTGTNNSAGGRKIIGRTQTGTAPHGARGLRPRWRLSHSRNVKDRTTLGPRAHGECSRLRNPTGLTWKELPVRSTRAS